MFCDFLARVFDAGRQFNEKGKRSDQQLDSATKCDSATLHLLQETDQLQQLVMQGR